MSHSLSFSARSTQIVLILGALAMSWLGMQAVHESGHVLGALASGGRVERVVLDPLTISRSDISDNPQPLLVVWAGPIWGVVAPLLIWGLVAVLRLNFAFVCRFFAGFCLIANGAYIGLGSFAQIGDCGELLRNGAPLWSLWLFGLLTVPPGFYLWNGQGSHFGLGPQPLAIDRRIAYGVMILAVMLAASGWLWFGE